MKQRTRTVKDLPKWAQELFHAQEEKSVALFPLLEEPEPLPRPAFGYYRGWSYAPYGQWVRLEEISPHGKNVKLYASKEDALKALRWEMARLYARDLLKVDRRLEEERDERKMNLLHDLEKRTKEREYLAVLLAEATGGIVGCSACPFKGKCPDSASLYCDDPESWIEASRRGTEEACPKN